MYRFIPGVFSAQVKVFVTGLFSLNQDIAAFKEHLRDFLVQIKVRLRCDQLWSHPACLSCKHQIFVLPRMELIMMLLKVIKQK